MMFRLDGRRALLRASLLLLLLAPAACDFSLEAEDPVVREVPVEVMDLRAEDIPVTGEWLGTVQPRTRVTVVAKVAGEVLSAGVDTGDPVEEGQVLARIDDVDYVNVRDETRAMLEVAEANLFSAESSFRRIKSLHEKKVTSQERYDAVHAAYQVALARVEQARAARDRALTNLERTRVKSPLAGWVSRRLVEPGDQVAPGRPLFEVMDLSQVKVRINVTEEEYATIDTQDAAEVAVDAYPGETFAGRIDRVGIDADLTTRTFPVEIAVENPDRRIASGMIARVRITRYTIPDGIRIPQHALLIRGEAPYAFVRDDQGVAELRALVLGVRWKGEVLVKEGLRPGDHLIVQGQHFLTQGDRTVIASKGEDGGPPQQTVN